MGLGRFGGGVGVTKWLAEQGAKVLVTDLLPTEKLGDSIAQIQSLIDANKVSLCLGQHRDSDFTNADTVIANPAVPKPWENRFLNLSAAAGIPITTEIRLGWPVDKTTVGVTGGPILGVPRPYTVA